MTNEEYAKRVQMVLDNQQRAFEIDMYTRQLQATAKRRAELFAASYQNAQTSFLVQHLLHVRRWHRDE